MNAPRIARRWDASVVLTFPFDAWLVDSLKEEIPAHARQYDPVAKSWTVAAACAGVATRLMHQVFTDVEMTDAHAGPVADREGDPREAASTSSGGAVGRRCRTMSAASRCLARLHHPDRGGEHADMLRLNQALEVLR